MRLQILKIDSRFKHLSKAIEINNQQLVKMAKGNVDTVKDIKKKLRVYLKDEELKQKQMDQLINILAAIELIYIEESIEFNSTKPSRMFIDDRRGDNKNFIHLLITGNKISNFIDALKTNPSIDAFYSFSDAVKKADRADLNRFEFKEYKQARQISPEFKDGTAYFVLLDGNNKPVTCSDVEGKLGGHCGNKYADRDDETKYIISLRNSDLNKPKVFGTFIIDNDDTLIESKGKANTKIDVEKHQDALKWLIDSKYVKGIESQDYAKEINFHISDMFGIDNEFVSKYERDENYLDGEFDDYVLAIKNGEYSEEEILDLLYDGTLSLAVIRNIGLEGKIDKYKLYKIDKSKITENEDGSIDYDGDIDMNNKDLKEIPFNFNRVNGHFNVSSNKLTSLKGSPKYIKTSFFCHKNNLTSLEGCPDKVKSFLCYENELTSLKYGPSVVGRDYDCSNNKLTSTEYVPKYIKGDFIAVSNKLTTLKGPDKIDGLCALNENQLTSLVGGPKMVNDDYLVQRNKLTSLKGCPDKVMHFNCAYNKLTSLVGGPTETYGYICGGNMLTDLVGAPEETSGRFSCVKNRISSLDGIPKEIDGGFSINDNAKKFTEDEIRELSKIDGTVRT